MMKKENRKKWMIKSGFLFLLMMVLVFVFAHPMKKETSFHEPDYQLSFLVGGAMNNAWGNMKKGADMAANDVNATINFIPMGQGTMDPPTLQQMLQEELKTPTQAIILAPDGTLTKEDLNFKTPLIFAGDSELDDQQRPYIGCDNQKMGRSLADDIIRHGNFRSRILIFVQKEANDSTKQILNELIKTLKKEHNEVRVQYLDTVDEQRVYPVLIRDPVQVVVALGDKQLEELANVARKLEKEKKPRVEVYGIGNSKEIIAGIEDNSIMSTIIRDDFSIGYLSVRCGVDTIQNKRCAANGDLRFAVIDKENMYKKENEWLLFPFVR